MSFHKKPKTINPDDVDPSVYYYDEVYDDMKDEEKAERDDASSSAKSKEQGSKYIKGLLETAQLRKTEKEIRKFKKYARDREEAEADGLIDQTEVYVTAAYKRKLEEINRMDKEKRSRIESEENLTFNTHKRYSRSKKDVVDTACNDNAHIDGSGVDQPNSPQQGSSQYHTADATDSDRRPMRQLKTSEDRKCFLRGFLAKRTIGDKFVEAVRRFKERQASGQPII